MLREFLIQKMDEKGIKRLELKTHYNGRYFIHLDILHPKLADKILASAPRNIIGE
jgi:hypothetical protein